MTLEDAALEAYEEGEPLPSAPRLVSHEADPRVYLEDGALRRHVPSPDAMDAWRFEWGAIEAIDAASLEALEVGEPIEERPWRVRGSGPAVYLVDAPPPAPPVPDGGPIAVRDASIVPGRDGGTGTDRAGGGGLVGGCAVARGGRAAWPGMALSLALAALVLARSRRRGRGLPS